MINFCEGVARTIRSAKTMKEVDEVILMSFKQFEERKSNSHPTTFAINMIVTLQIHISEISDKHQWSNVTYGIAMYREHQVKQTTALF